MKKYPRYFSVCPTYSKQYGYKYVRVDSKSSSGLLVCFNGEVITTSTKEEYFEKTHKEILIYEAVLM